MRHGSADGCQLGRRNDRPYDQCVPLLMWCDYGFIRPGRIPSDVYQDGVLTLSSNQVAPGYAIGTLVGQFSVIGLSGTFLFSIKANSYFSISGANLVVAASLLPQLFWVEITARRGQKIITRPFLVKALSQPAIVPTYYFLGF